ncbi:MAG TPA: hypothetical protein VFR78_14120 [Pyrinomonadaceae bacterium]|nr:hypothetical protein [Pyrinomonadaceae bacterium]
MFDGKRECPDCHGQMVAGFILDVGAHSAPRWLEGQPEISVWTGVKAKGKECRLVTTYRCVECGLLRSYAVVEVDPPNMWRV